MQYVKRGCAVQGILTLLSGATAVFPLSVHLDTSLKLWAPDNRVCLTVLQLR